MANRALLTTGLVLVAAAILVPTLMFTIGASSDDWANAIGGILFAFVISPILFIAGLVLIIVGATRGRQQQQQQVVIVQGDAPAAGGLACRSCRQLMPFGARFCTHCGAKAA